jgi:hypothetical protein
MCWTKVVYNQYAKFMENEKLKPAEIRRDVGGAAMRFLGLGLAVLDQAFESNRVYSGTFVLDDKQPAQIQTLLMSRQGIYEGTAIEGGKESELNVLLEIEITNSDSEEGRIEFRSTRFIDYSS